MAKTEEDLETAALLMTTKSGLRTLDSVRLLAYAKRLDRLIGTHLEALVTMGWNEQAQIAFALALESYSEQVMSPRHKVVLRVQATQELKWLFEEADALLKDDLDAMVDMLEDTSPEFLTAYESSRKVADPYKTKGTSAEASDLETKEDEGERDDDSFLGY